MKLDELHAALTEIAGDRPEAAPAYAGVVHRVQRARRRRLGAVAAAVAVVVTASFIGIRALGNDDSLPRVATSVPTTLVTVAPTTTTITVPPRVQSALDAWKGFPVDASPRPLIISEPVNAPDNGFPSDDTKLAWESGQFRVRTTLPTTPSTSGGYPLISGQTAIDHIVAEATPGPTATQPLTITAVTLGSAQFSTDRGMQQLPAWLVTFAGIANPAQVLAVAQSALFTPPATVAPAGGGGGGGAVTLVGDRTLQVHVFGKAAGDGPCEARYEVHAYESDQAVAIVTREIPKPPSAATPTSDPNLVCSDVGYMQTVTTTITRPLGNRVVVNGATHAPVAVTSAGG